MKKRGSELPLLIALLIIPLFPLNAQEEEKVNYSNPETWLLGYFEVRDFLMAPHAEWYNKGFDEYLPDDQCISELSAIETDEISIIIVLGTWCPDSRRELPRFMKILDAWDFPGEQVTLIGVDSHKMAPLDNYEELDIERVPTFIFYRNKVEAGRIIEYPKASLEKDITDILNEK